MRKPHLNSHPQQNGPGRTSPEPVLNLKPGALGGTRTHDQLLRRQLLYPLSYEGAERPHYGPAGDLNRSLRGHRKASFLTDAYAGPSPYPPSDQELAGGRTTPVAG